MQVELEHTGKLERKLTVKFPADKLDQQVSERVARMGREVRLKGFRPGRVPKGVIEKRYGQQIRGEVLSELVNETFRDAVRQESLEPAAAPAINTSGEPEDGEIAYTATFEVMPELPTVDASGLTVERPVAEVTSEDVDEMIETLRKQRRTFEPVEREAADGDLVLFEFEADTSDGRFPAEGRERAGTVLGSGEFNEDVEKALAGLAADADFKVEATFADSFRFDELAGKLCQIRGRVVRVQEERLPDVNAEFFKAFGILDGDEDSFRQAVRENLERELNAALAGRLKAAVAEALANSHGDIEVPRVMVVGEARSMLPLSRSDSLSEEQFRQVEPVARQRVIAGLLFVKIANDEGIKVDDQRVGKSLAAIASTYEEPEQVVELYRSNPDLMNGLRSGVLEEQVAEWVAEHAECVDKSMSFDDVMRPGGAG